MHDDLRDSLVRLGAVPLVEQCEMISHAPGDDSWRALCAPSTICLVTLSGSRHEPECYVGLELLVYIGADPISLMRRLLLLISEVHGCGPSEIIPAAATRINALWIRTLDCSVDFVIDALGYPCPICDKHIRVHSLPPPQMNNIHSLLRALLGYTKLSLCPKVDAPSDNTLLSAIMTHS